LQLSYYRDCKLPRSKKNFLLFWNHLSRGFNPLFCLFFLPISNWSICPTLVRRENTLVAQSALFLLLKLSIPAYKLFRALIRTSISRIIVIYLEGDDGHCLFFHLNFQPFFFLLFSFRDLPPHFVRTFIASTIGLAVSFWRRLNFLLTVCFLRLLFFLFHNTYFSSEAIIYAAY